MESRFNLEIVRSSDSIVINKGSNNKPSALLFLAHGVGSSMDDLLPFAEGLANSIEGLCVIVLQGGEAFDGGNGRHQWFSIKGVTEANRPARVAEVLPDFRQRILAETKRLDLTPERVLIGGFSQGAIMSLALGAAGPEEWLGVIAMSGRLPSQAVTKSAGHALIVHGDDDRVMPPELTHMTTEWLTQKAWEVEAHILPNLGHGIDQRVLVLATAFAQQRIAAMPHER